MRLISHRGNIKGQNPERENMPAYVLETIEKTGYDVEVDVWLIENQFYLGHDKPQYEIKDSFLSRPHLWCHAKNLNALGMLLEMGVKCFWHEEDKYALTSNNIIWTFPKECVIIKSIIVCQSLEESKEYFKKDIFGICSDFVGVIK